MMQVTFWGYYGCPDCGGSVSDVQCPTCLARAKTEREGILTYTDTTDKDCICKGNWRAIVKANEHLIGKKFAYNDPWGTYHIFVGVMHGDDDYYYVMFDIASERCKFLSCVGSLETHGYTLEPDETSTEL